MGTVYLIKLDAPLGDTNNPKGYAQFYIGYTSRSLKERLEDHKQGRGSALLRAANERGINWHVTRTWKGDRKLERRLKTFGHAPLLCPETSGEAAYRRYSQNKTTKKKEDIYEPAY